MIENIPHIGVGIGWRDDISKSILANLEHIDWCELIAEHFIDTAPDKLAEIADLSRTIPIVPHGVDLSIGTDEPVEFGYLCGLKRVIDAVNAPFHTDHLCFTRVPGYNLGQLGPLQFSEKVVDIIAPKAREITRFSQRPLLLENITYDFVVPGATMTEAQFISSVLVKGDIGLLLDVTNVVINAANHRFDPYAFVDGLPMDRVVQLHIAGGYQTQGKWVDSHSHPVPDAVFSLMEYVLERANVKGILLERDSNYPESFGDLTDELIRAREMLTRATARFQAMPAANAVLAR